MILDRMFGPRADSGWVNRSSGDDYWWGPRTGAADTGVNVTEETALMYSTVYACVGKIASTVAALPFAVYERRPDGGKVMVADHPLYHILHTQANSEMPASAFWEAFCLNLLLWGTGYAEKLVSRRGELLELHPLYAKEIKPKRNERGQLIFEHRPEGRALPDTLDRDRCFWAPGLTLNGLVGLTPIGWQRETIGLGIAATKFEAKFFGNGAAVPWALKHPKHLDDKAYKRLMESLAERHGGVGNAHKPMVLEEDMSIEKIGINPRDAEFLELRKFQRREICGIYGVPPHKIGDLENAHYNNVEEQNIEWVVDCIMIWCNRIATAVNTQLLDPKGKIFAEHVLLGLLKGDVSRRYSAYAVARNWGWLSTNDIRRLENMNPIPGGDDYLIPGNMAVRDENGDMRPALVQEQNQPENDSSQAADLAALLPLLSDASARIVAKECNAIETAWKRRAKEASDAGFKQWAVKFFADHELWMCEVLRPVAATAQALTGNAMAVETLAAQHCLAAHEEVLGGVSNIPALLSDWRATREGQLTERLTTAFGTGE